MDEDILQLGKGPFAVEIDLMQPIDPEKAPKVHVPTLNHIGLWVDDIQAAVTELGEKGVSDRPPSICLPPAIQVIGLVLVLLLVLLLVVVFVFLVLLSLSRPPHAGALRAGGY